MRLRNGLIGEEIDGEVVMIDLAIGIYYSLRGGAVVVWRLLGVGASQADLVAALTATYDVDSATAAEAVDQLLVSMQRDALIVDESAALPSHDSMPANDRRPFEPLEYERFDDMAHIIQLDPIHDVDPTHGWPLQAD